MAQLDRPARVRRPGSTRADPDLEELINFLNTNDIWTGRDRLADAGRAGRWLRAHRILRPDQSLDGAQTRLLRRAREAFRSLIVSRDQSPTDHSLVVIRRTTAQVRYRLTIDDDGAPSLKALGGEVHRIVGRLMIVVIVARAEEKWERVKICRNPECGKLFFDESRNRSRAWCAMQRCGNQSKARAFRGRKTTASAAEIDSGSPSPS